MFILRIKIVFLKKIVWSQTLGLSTLYRAYINATGQAKNNKIKARMPEYCDNQKTVSGISLSQPSQSVGPLRSGLHQVLGALSPSLSLSLILVRSICPGHRFQNQPGG